MTETLETLSDDPQPKPGAWRRLGQGPEPASGSGGEQPASGSGGEQLSFTPRTWARPGIELEESLKGVLPGAQRTWCRRGMIFHAMRHIDKKIGLSHAFAARSPLQSFVDHIGRSRGNGGYG